MLLAFPVGLCFVPLKNYIIIFSNNDYLLISSMFNKSCWYYWLFHYLSKLYWFLIFNAYEVPLRMLFVTLNICYRIEQQWIPNSKRKSTTGNVVFKFHVFWLSWAGIFWLLFFWFFYKEYGTSKKIFIDWLSPHNGAGWLHEDAILWQYFDPEYAIEARYLAPDAW